MRSFDNYIYHALTNRRDFSGCKRSEERRHYSNPRHNRPPEDYREVMVSRRGSGKTSELLSVAYQKLERGIDVIYCVPHRDMADHIKMMFYRRYDLYPTHDSVRHRRTNAGIFFLDIRNYHINKERYFRGRAYKILDEALIESDFDLISITGNEYRLRGHDERSRDHHLDAMRYEMMASAAIPPAMLKSGGFDFPMEDK